jgi:FhuF 2Fe-2S C-terminal domain
VVSVPDQPDPEVDARPALEAAAGLGPYFVWQPWDGEAGWRPLAQLTDAEVVAERVENSRNTLMRMSGLDRADIGVREVASITFLGIASRLVSPLLGAAAVGGAVPAPDRERMWWRAVPGGPVPIAVHRITAVDCGDRDAAAIAETLTRTAVRGLIEPVLEAFGDRFAVSRQVLWGNVASALGGAAGMIADSAPGRAARAASILEQMLAQAPLRGTAALMHPDPRRARWFLVRNNCCLYYRIPGGGTCGDCVLTPDDERRRQWRSVLGS